MFVVVFNTLIVVACVSSSDCSGDSVCKEMTFGGLKTCQDSSSCPVVCSDGMFCNSANSCQYG